MTNRFVPLLQREWMQHQRGWLLLMAAPLVLVLLASVFAPIGMQVQIDGETVVQKMPPAGVQALMSLAGMAALTLMMALVSTLFQAPGLARRDHQDRSIEFWLALPTGHAQSIAATLLAHLLLLPWLALAVGAMSGLLVSLVVVAKSWGVGAWLGMPWGSVLPASLALLARVAVGILLAMLWLSPLILGLMAASAWLKRWGVPVVIGSVAGLGTVLQQVYGNSLVWDVLGGLVHRASRAFIAVDRSGQSALLMRLDSGKPYDLQGIPAWALQDLGQALQGLVSPAFAAALVVSAACFGLLVLRRRRGG